MKTKAITMRRLVAIALLFFSVAWASDVGAGKAMTPIAAPLKTL